MLNLQQTEAVVDVPLEVKDELYNTIVGGMSNEEILEALNDEMPDEIVWGCDGCDFFTVDSAGVKLEGLDALWLWSGHALAVAKMIVMSRSLQKKGLLARSPMQESWLQGS